MLHEQLLFTSVSVTIFVLIQLDYHGQFIDITNMSLLCQHGITMIIRSVWLSYDYEISLIKIVI